MWLTKNAKSKMKTKIKGVYPILSDEIPNILKKFPNKCHFSKVGGYIPIKRYTKVTRKRKIPEIEKIELVNTKNKSFKPYFDFFESASDNKIPVPI